MTLNLEASLTESTSRLARFLQQKCSTLKLKITLAESCTGGLASAYFTDIEGSSTVFGSGFITYSNEAKEKMLGVNANTLDTHGAVSEEVATEMMFGALQNSSADLSIAITGIAGPTGGSDEKPVGTVCFAWGNRKGFSQSSTEQFEGNRVTIRQAAVNYAFQQLIDLT